MKKKRKKRETKNFRISLFYLNLYLSRNMPKITPTMTNRVYIPHKRIYAPNDPFFTEGNIELRAIWLKKQAQSDLEVDIIQQEAVDLSK